MISARPIIVQFSLQTKKFVVGLHSSLKSSFGEVLEMFIVSVGIGLKAARFSVPASLSKVESMGKIE